MPYFPYVYAIFAYFGRISDKFSPFFGRKYNGFGDTFARPRTFTEAGKPLFVGRIGPSSPPSPISPLFVHYLEFSNLSYLELSK